MVSKRPYANSKQLRALRHHQQGKSFLTWMVILAVAAIFASVGLKTIPHYVENRTIVSVLESIDNSVLKSGSKKKVLDLVNKRLKINNVRDYQGKDILQFKRTKDASYMVMHYEVRENVYANLDLLIVFDKEFHY